MATTINVKHLGDNQTVVTHGPTKNTLITDLPPDNAGKGRTFSPTDLFATSLASCILTIMGKMAETNSKSLKDCAIDIEKIMQENPRRVAKFIIDIKFPEGVDEKDKIKYLKAVEACPVHRSLHPDIKIELRHN